MGTTFDTDVHWIQTNAIRTQYRKVGDGMKKDFIVRRSITMIDGKPHVETYSEQELVRCKDCKYGQYEEWDNGECVDKTVYCDGYGIHKPDWFCADGERRD